LLFSVLLVDELVRFDLEHRQSVEHRNWNQNKEYEKDENDRVKEYYQI